MAWIRLSDDYVDDEKVQALTDGAFRLWHEALAYARRHQTDGVIPFVVMKGLRSYTKSREKQLAIPARDGIAPLWELVPATGYKIHNYLDWNPSKDEENERRSESKERMRLLREQRRIKGVPPDRLAKSSPPVRANILRSSPDVLGMGMGTGGEGCGENPDRVSAFMARYPAIYAKCRSGAGYRVKEARDFEAFVELTDRVTDDGRLDRLLELFLLTKKPNFLNDPGTPRQFLHMLPTVDQWLREAGQ